MVKTHTKLSHVRLAEPLLLEDAGDSAGCGAGGGPALDQSPEVNATDDTPVQPKIDRVAVCAGSGGSVFKALKKNFTAKRSRGPENSSGGATSAFLCVTGEISHHDALEICQKGGYVICTEHSNSERGFISDKFRQQVLEKFGEKQRNFELDIRVSASDKDPLRVV